MTLKTLRFVIPEAMQAKPETIQRLARCFDQAGTAFVAGKSIPRAEYAELAGLNASVLKQATTLEMLYALQRDFDPMKYERQFGSLLHLAILEPDKFDDLDRSEWLVELKTKTLDTKEGEAALAAHPGKIIATSRMIEKAGRAKDAAYRHKQFAAIMAQAPATEVAYQAWDDAWGGWRKGLVDIVPQSGSWLGDLKSTAIDLTDRRRIEREARDYGYNFSGAYYADLHEQITGQAVDNYVIVWISGPKGEYADESATPWMCRLQVIPRTAVSPEPCLVEQFPVIRARLESLKAAYRFDEWVAFEDEVCAF